MKKVYLHGALGKHFGKEWELNVSTPAEAIHALFANNPEIEKYLNNKHQEGVYYGIKKSGEKNFSEAGDYPLSTDKDLHLFPIPQGAGFAGSLLWLAATTAASMYVNKKVAEAMERDDSVTQTQTQSYIYNGADNRFSQGATIPIGYGKVNVGSNVISACAINYDYNSENGKIFSFSNGIHSLVPSYSKYYNPLLGPLVSSFARSVFDGESKYRIVDPAFQYITERLSSSIFGTVDGLYGGFKPLEEQKNEITSVKEKTGNWIGGYYYYNWNYAKGIDPEFLRNNNFQADGNWYPNGWATADIPEQESKRFAVPESNALKSSFVCLQSIPVQDSETLSEKIFYPIIWSEDTLPDLKRNEGYDKDGAFPVPVGERWRAGIKESGVGWHKLESTSVYKSIDLISEGEIDGFSDKNGKLLEFDSGHYTDTSSVTPMRNEKDDYLQGVFLNETPVKEISFQKEDDGLDAYNINEFDIDVAMNDDGSMGAEDQRLLEDQYLFTAYTKEINSRLYGPRAVNFDEMKYILPTEPFEQGNLYELGEYITYNDNTYRVIKDMNNAFRPKTSYASGDFVYIENNGDYSFYQANEGIDEYKLFSGEYVTHDGTNFDRTYQNGDKIRAESYDTNQYENGEMYRSFCYKTMGADAGKFLGTIDASIDYSNKVGYFIMDDINKDPVMNTNSPLYLITGATMQPGDSIDSFSSLIYYEDGDVSYGSDPIWLLENLDTVYGGTVANLTNQDGNSITVNLSNSLNVIGSTQDITPPNTNLWDPINITNPESMPDYFRKFTGEDLDSVASRMMQEENYISHTIINPLVEEAYISLQLDELGYNYEGDHVEVTYKIGELWNILLVAWQAYHMYKLGEAGNDAIDNFAKAKTNVEMAAALSAYFPIAAAVQQEEAALHTKMGKQQLLTVAKEALIIVAIELVKQFINPEDGWKIGTKIENAGEVWPNKAKFRIKYGNEGEEPYSTDIFFYGVATSAYRKDIKIYFPPNPDQRDRIIKVYKLNRERNFVKEGEQAARYKETMSFAGVTEITPVKMNYPNSVVIGTRVNAKDMSSVPKRTYHMRMKKVMIPSNYNPETRRYVGNWDGLFQIKPKWTDNPAWCLYDLISNKRFGVGKFGIKDENIDRWTLYKMAKYCDQLVPSGYSPKYKKRRFSEISQLSLSEFAREFRHPGKKLAIFHDDGTYESIGIKETKRNTKEVVLEYPPSSEDFDCAVEIDYPLIEPRYTMNAYIMNKQNAFKLINEMAQIFRSYSYWSGGAINFFQDEKKDAVMLFSNNNISEEGFNYSGTPKTSRTNSCNIKYVDRYNMYRAKIERAEDREAVQENSMIEQTIDGFGITSQAQAKRAVEFLVKGANLETEIIAFKTSMLGSYLKPGDIIDVIDNKRTVGRFAGKIIDVDLDDRGMKGEVTIDYPIHTYIDKEDKKTWKTITLYSPTGNETIKSLDSSTKVTDEDISNIRAKQIGEYLVYDISEDNRKLKIYNTPYSYVSGEYTWFEALKDSKERGGRIATVNDEDEQIFMESELPADGTGWLGGYQTELPEERLIWHSDESCDTNYIYYSDWAEGFPKFSRPLDTDTDNTLQTDLPEQGFLISADSIEDAGNFLFTTGSSDKDVHGDWMHTSGQVEMGYMLERVTNDSLEGILESEGTTFVLEDKVNLANKKQYKILNIAEESNGLYAINGLQYNVDKFDNIEKNLSIKNPEHPVIFTDGDIFGNT